VRRLPLVLVVALGIAAGCEPADRRDAGAPAGAQGDPYAVLVEGLRSGQPPLEALAAETFVDADRQPPRADLVRLVQARDPRVRTVGLALVGTTRRRDLLPVIRQQRVGPAGVVPVARAFALAMLGDPSEVTALRDALASPDVTVRRTAVWLFGLMGNPSAVGMLKVKLDDLDAVVVLRAAEALHRLGSTAGLQRVRRLTEHNRHQIRAYAVRLLGRMGETADIPRLERLCLSRFLDVKFAAIGALAQQGDFKRIEMLTEFLEAEDQQARLLAARELGETAYKPALKPLERLLAARDLWERTTAAAAMVHILSVEDSWRSRILAEEKPPALDDAITPRP